MADRSDIPEMYQNDEDLLDLFEDLTERPFAQATVVAAEFDNQFFADEKNNKTYPILKLSDDQVKTQWNVIHPLLTNGKISPKIILSIIELAMNVRAVETEGILLGWKARSVTLLQNMTTLSDVQLMTSKMAQSLKRFIKPSEDYTLPSPEDDGAKSDDEDDDTAREDNLATLARGACYLCMCLLRLMKKEPNSFYNGIVSIKKGFSQFYDTASTTVLNIEISKTAILAISDGLRNNAMLCQTIVYHVATGMAQLDRTSQSYHLMRFSFCQHTELKGMHAYKLFYDIDGKIGDKLPTAVFLSWITTDITVKATTEIYSIIKNYDNKEKQHEYLWLYARYLNNGYFYNLHTARCRWLTYVLACLSKTYVPVPKDSKSNPLELRELEKLPKSDKDSAKEYAEIFEESFGKQSIRSNIMNRNQRILQARRGVPASSSNPKRKRHMESDDMNTDDISEIPAVPEKGQKRKEDNIDKNKKKPRYAGITGIQSEAPDLIEPDSDSE